jgi:cysteine protease ATG4
VALCPCFEEQEELVFCEKHMAWERDLAIIVLCRIGLDSPQEKYLQALEHMFELESFSGAIGGRPRSALFMMGKNQRRFIYMDPHYVRSSIDPGYIEARDQFGCPSLRELDSHHIDCSLGVTFFLRSGQQLNDLYNQLRALKRDNEEGMFIFMEKNTPSYLKKND